MLNTNFSSKSEDESPNEGELDSLSEQLAVTRECPAPVHLIEAALVAEAARAATQKTVPALSPAAAPAAATSTPEVSKKPKAAASETMHAYVPQGVQAGPLSTTARIALQGAQSQLNGSVPMVLADRAAPVGVPVKKGTPEEKSVVESSSKRTRPILLGVVAAVVFAAVVWNFYPGNPGVGHGGGAGGLRATAASATSTQATLPPLREAAAIPCLTDSTQYRSSAERDELLRSAISEFALGRLERAHSLLIEYQQVSCDRATLEALSILEHQFTQKTRDH